jgi:hypothetical protein
MSAIAPTDLARMRDALLFDGPERARKLSRFWTLLVRGRAHAADAPAGPDRI